MDEVASFQANRRRLFGLAYRLLGDAAAAEDIVQDAYLNWDRRDRFDTPIRAPAAWLTKVVTNLCLNRLASARATREHYVGAWLPTPVLTPVGNELGPLETVEQRETVTVALLALLERLTAPERAVFILREAFDYPYRDIAEIIDRDEVHVRQLGHRARQRLHQDRPKRFAASPQRHAQLVSGFLEAAADGNVESLKRLLVDDVAALTDGGGKGAAALHPVLGAGNVAHYFGRVAAHPRATGVRIRVCTVNAEPALLAFRGDHLDAIAAIEASDEGITALHTIVNPDKLAYATAHLPNPSAHDADHEAG